ncbi:MAG TPA: zinc ribbon domain-containing protein [Terriglobia bacterium]|nr:zinc ribbon domain-containing protein [Terriglobia bacterium]
MAQFCTKCGTPLPEGMRFCTGCGATLGEPPAPAAAPTPAMAVPSPSPVAPAAAPAASSSSPVLKIILIVVAVFIFLGLVTAMSCVYFVYRAKQKMTQIEKQAQATFPMQTGTQGANIQPTAPGQAPPQESATPIDPATLIYPGATAKEGASMALGGFQVQQYTTDDSVDKVLSFYKDKLGPKALVQQTDKGALVQVVGQTGLFTITIARDEASAKTTFSITRIGK